MNILFICGTFHPHKDAVADYIARLSIELINCGHSVFVIAINDSSVQDSLGHVQFNDIKVLQIPSSFTWLRKSSITLDYSADIRPDKVSLQFVPFSYSRKGTLFGFLKYLTTLNPLKIDHIMFHELWVHPKFCVKLSHLILGQIQRLQIKRIIREINPRIIHTSNIFFAEMLDSIGYQCSVSPIPGNIPVVCSTSSHSMWMSDQLRVDANSIRTIGFFGDFLPTFNLDLLKSLLIQESTHEKQLYILSAGRLSARGAKIWNEILINIPKNVHFYSFGFLSLSDMSIYLNSINTPVSSYPPELWKKSGAVASFLDHNKSVTLLGSLSPKPSFPIDYSNLVQIQPSNATSFPLVSSLLLKSFKCSRFASK